MQKNYRFAFYVTVSLFSQFHSFQVMAGGDKALLRWVVNPFDNNSFIENNGQFDNRVPGHRQAVLFGVEKEGIGLYFCSTGICFQKEAESGNNNYDAESAADQEQTEHEKKREITCLFMNWLGAEKDVRLAGSERQNFEYIYSAREGSREKSTRAAGFRKLKYINLYPGIDVEYAFPEGRSGFKYTIIVHPGADLSKIRMHYSSSRIKKNSVGDVLLDSEFGEILDHAPRSFDPDGHEVQVEFHIQGNVVSFIPGKNYNPHKTLIIDPWTTTPPFNRPVAYDVDYDLQGNVYAYGRPGGLTSYCQLVKLDNTGNILWVFNAMALSSFYGDFAVDGTSESVYLICGWSSPGNAGILKLDSQGNQIASFTEGPTMNELWRIVFNNCTKKGVIGGGGLQGTNQIMALDTTLTTMTPLNVIRTAAPQHDITLLGLDNNGDCFMLFSRSYPAAQAALFNNVLVKAPLSNLSNLSFSVPGNYAFREYTIPMYGTGVVANGFNGMATSNKYLYTYDGKLLQRWNKGNGAVTNSKTLSGTAMRWAGIAVDLCDRIYLGLDTRIAELDSAMIQMNTITMPDTVYDVRIGPGNTLYASGKNFVASIQLTNTNQFCGNCNQLSISSTQVNPACYGACNGLATVTVNSGGQPPFAYSWNTVPPQTGSRATNLCAGTYTCTILDANNQQSIYVITLAQPPALKDSATQRNVTCDSLCNGVAHVTGSGGTGSLHYSWNTNPPNTTSSLSGLCAGTYTCMITDSMGCTLTRTITITQPPPLTVNASSLASCGINNGNASVTVTGGYPPYQYSWNTVPVQTTNQVAGLTAGNYTCTVTDSNACTKSASVNVVTYPPPTIHGLGYRTINYNDTVSLNPVVGGAVSYYWSPPDGLSCTNCPDPVARPLSTTTYCLEVLSNKGCQASACETIQVDINCGEVFVPTAFSPNEDGRNELECVYGNCITEMNFVIYDRWGEAVFTSHDTRVCWDGTYHGLLLDTGVFVYYLEATLVNGTSVRQKGNISLIR